MSSREITETENSESIDKAASRTDEEYRRGIIRNRKLLGLGILATTAVATFIATRPNGVDMNGHSRWWSLLVVPLGFFLGFVFYPEKKLKDRVRLRFLLPIGVGIIAIFLIENWGLLNELANQMKYWGFQATTKRGAPAIREESLQLLYNKAMAIGVGALSIVIGLEFIGLLTGWKVASKTPVVGLFLSTIFLGLFLVRGLESVASVLLGFVTAIGIGIGIVLFCYVCWLIGNMATGLLKGFWLAISGQAGNRK